MDIRPVTPDYAVSPQIAPDDIPAIVAAGYVALIDNRPDGEIPPEIGSAAIREAAAAAGLAFHHNPVTNGAMTLDNVVAQGRVLDAAGGPVLAYCRSGTRSTIVWALSRAGRLPADEIVALAAAAGYDLARMRDQLTAAHY